MEFLGPKQQLGITTGIRNTACTTERKCRTWSCCHWYQRSCTQETGVTVDCSLHAEVHISCFCMYGLALSLPLPFSCASTPLPSVALSPSLFRWLFSAPSPSPSFCERGVTGQRAGLLVGRSAQGILLRRHPHGRGKK